MKRALLLALACLSLNAVTLAQKNQPINIMSYNIRLNVASDGVNAGLTERII